MQKHHIQFGGDHTADEMSRGQSQQQSCDDNQLKQDLCDRFRLQFQRTLRQPDDNAMTEAYQYWNQILILYAQMQDQARGQSCIAALVETVAWILIPSVDSGYRRGCKVFCQ